VVAQYLIDEALGVAMLFQEEVSLPFFVAYPPHTHSVTCMDGSTCCYNSSRRTEVLQTQGTQSAEGLKKM